MANIAKGWVKGRHGSTETIQTMNLTGLLMANGMKSTKTLQTNLSSLLMEIGTELVNCRQTTNLNSLLMEIGIELVISLQVKDPTRFCDTYLDKADAYSLEEEREGVMTQPFRHSTVPLSHNSTQAQAEPR